MTIAAAGNIAKSAANSHANSRSFDAALAHARNKQDSAGNSQGKGPTQGQGNNPGDNGGGAAHGVSNNPGQDHGNGFSSGANFNPGFGHNSPLPGQVPSFGLNWGGHGQSSTALDAMFAAISHGPPALGSTEFGRGAAPFNAASFYHVTSILDGSFGGPFPFGQQIFLGQAGGFFELLTRQAQTPEEIYLLNAMSANGKAPEDALNALLTLRQWRLLELAGWPGVALASRPLRGDGGPWLGQMGANIAQVPPEVAAKLEGREFKSFAGFSQAFWRAVADTPELAAQFSAANLARMRAGAPPLAPQSQRFDDLSAYMIYHKAPVSQGGALYDMSNMLVVTPFMYQAVLDPRYQSVILNIMHSGHMSARVLLKRRRRVRRYSERKQDFAFGRWARRKLRDFRRRYRGKQKPGRKAPQKVPTVLIGQILPPLRRARQASLRLRRRARPPVITHQPMGGSLTDGLGPEPA